MTNTCTKDGSRIRPRVYIKFHASLPDDTRRLSDRYYIPNEPYVASLVCRATSLLDCTTPSPGSSCGPHSKGSAGSSARIFLEAPLLKDLIEKRRHTDFSAVCPSSSGFDPSCSLSTLWRYSELASSALPNGTLGMAAAEGPVSFRSGAPVPLPWCRHFSR